MPAGEEMSMKVYRIVNTKNEFVCVSDSREREIASAWAIETEVLGDGRLRMLPVNRAIDAAWTLTPAEVKNLPCVRREIINGSCPDDYPLMPSGALGMSAGNCNVSEWTPTMRWRYAYYLA